jgi:hypothetical protein
MRGRDRVWMSVGIEPVGYHWSIQSVVWFKRLTEVQRGTVLDALGTIRETLLESGQLVRNG